MKLNFLSNIFLFRWTRWFPVELWSLNTLRPRESPTSSTSTGVSITMPTMPIYGHMGHNGIEFSTNSSNPQESHPCWGEVLGREPQRSLQPQAGAGCHVGWHKRNISTFRWRTFPTSGRWRRAGTMDGIWRHGSLTSRQGNTSKRGNRNSRSFLQHFVSITIYWNHQIGFLIEANTQCSQL